MTVDKRNQHDLAIAKLWEKKKACREVIDKLTTEYSRLYKTIQRASDPKKYHPRTSRSDAHFTQQKRDAEKAFNANRRRARRYIALYRAIGKQISKHRRAIWYLQVRDELNRNRREIYRQSRLKTSSKIED